MYKIVSVESVLLITSDVTQKRPKLIKEKAAMHSASRFLFSFWSTIWPANKAVDRAGMISIKPISPRYIGSPVSS